MATTAARDSRPAPGPFDLLWTWLNSLPIAIVVMLLLAGFSALGTIIPQQHLAQPEMGQSLEQMYAARFGVAEYRELHLGNVTLRLPASRLAVIESLGLNKVYFTPYFFLLLLWLCVSAVVCNITRMRRTFNLWRHPPVKRGAGYYKADKRSVELSAVPADAVEQVVAELHHRRFRVRRLEEDGVTYLYADHGFYKKWGLVVLHIAVLVLLFGGIFGKSVGVEGMIRLADGEKKPLVLDSSINKHPLVTPLLKKLKPLVYNLDQGAFRIDYDKKLEMPSDVVEHVPPELHDYYRYFVKDFVSTLTVEQNGKTKSQEVKVNHPLVLNKLVLYQSGYQQMGYIEVEQGGTVQEYPVGPDTWFVLTPNGPVDPGSAMGSATEAYLLEQVKAGDLYVGGKPEGYIGPLTILHRANMMSGQDLGSQLLSPEQGLELTLNGAPAVMRMSKRVDNYSDFSYKRDPGIPILYLGWISMILGIAFALYIPFSQVWLRLEGSRAQLLLTGAGSQPEAPLCSRLHGILGAP